SSFSALELDEVRAASRTVGLEVFPFDIRRDQDIALAFDALKGHAEALYVIADPARQHQPNSHQHLGAGRATASTLSRNSSTRESAKARPAILAVVSRCAAACIRSRQEFSGRCSATNV